MHNEDNLKPVQTTEEARERGRNGGIASGKARRRKKTMRQAAEMLLDMQIPKAAPELKNRLKAMGISEEDMTYQTAIMIGMLNQAMKGNTKAAAFFRDLVGETPIPNEELEDSSLADAIEDAYEKRMGGADNAE